MTGSLWPAKAVVAAQEVRVVLVVTGVVVDMGEAAVTGVVPVVTAEGALEAWVAREGQGAPREARALRVMAVGVASGVARGTEEATRAAV
jgi:hypothetical protein